MKKGEKKGLLILVAVSIVIILIIFVITRNIGKEELEENKEEQEQKTETVEEQSPEEIIEVIEDGTIVNNSNKIKSNKEVAGFVVSNIKLTAKDEDTMVVADVTNKTGKNQEGFLVDIVLVGRNGETLVKIPGTIIETQNGETIEIRAEITGNYVSAYDLKLEKR